MEEWVTCQSQKEALPQKVSVLLLSLALWMGEWKKVLRTHLVVQWGQRT